MTGRIAGAAKWLGRRLATGCLYMLAIADASFWDDDPNSWFLILLRLSATAMFLSWAVRRTIGHWHEDQEGS